MSEQLSLDDVVGKLDAPPNPAVIVAKQSAPAVTRASKPVIVAFGALTIALAVAVGWGYTTNERLQATSGQLVAANATVTSQASELGRTQKNLQDQSAQVGALQGRVATQDACITTLRSAAKLLEQTKDKQLVAYGLLAEGSVWAGARQARDKALLAAVDDYYQGFSAAWDSRYSAANSWISRGNSELTTAGKSATVMNDEVAKVNALVDAIDAGLLAYSSLDLSTCGADTGGTPA
jgi:hypothetical protein